MGRTLFRFLVNCLSATQHCITQRSRSSNYAWAAPLGRLWTAQRECNLRVSIYLISTLSWSLIKVDSTLVGQLWRGNCDVVNRFLYNDFSVKAAQENNEEIDDAFRYYYIVWVAVLFNQLYTKKPYHTARLLLSGPDYPATCICLGNIPARPGRYLPY